MIFKEKLDLFTQRIDFKTLFYYKIEAKTFLKLVCYLNAKPIQKKKPKYLK